MVELTRQQSDQIVESLGELSDIDLMAMGMTALLMYEERMKGVLPEVVKVVSESRRRIELAIGMKDAAPVPQMADDAAEEDPERWDGQS